MKHFDNILNVCGVYLGLANIETFLGILLLILNITSILIKSGISIYKKVKNKQLKEAVQELDNTIDKIEEVVENAKNR